MENKTNKLDAKLNELSDDPEKLVDCLLTLLRALLIALGLFLPFWCAKHITPEHQYYTEMSIFTYVCAAVSTLSGIISSIVAENAGSYKCKTCGCVHVPLLSTEIMDYHIKKNNMITCFHCNKQTPHEKMPKEK